MDVMNWCDTAAKDCTPPSVEDEGLGSRAAPSVPLVMLPAFVVSVVALAARPLTRAFGTVPAASEPAISICQSDVPVADLKFRKLPAGEVLVARWLVMTSSPLLP